MKELFYCWYVNLMPSLTHTHQGLYIHVLILEIRKMKLILRMYLMKNGVHMYMVGGSSPN